MSFTAYTSERPPRLATSEELRSRIPGWGADLDPANRPAVPRERFDSTFGGAHWDFPERQQEKYPRERSLEHRMLTPVFGTVTPPKGLSGAIRRLAYRRYSEGRAAHWLLLIVGDRVDAGGAHLRSLLTLRPDNPITESGVLGEIGHHPISSRFGKKRADTRHMWMDPIIVAGPWIVAGGVLLAIGKAAMRAPLR
jgi:hypothetical protein